MQVGIIGIGLIGGSMAIDLKKRGFADRIVGVENNHLHAAAAVEIGLVDEVVSLDECVAQSDIIVVATPVNVAIRLIPEILDKVDTQIVTDVCSTKEKINEIVHPHKDDAHVETIIHFFYHLHSPKVRVFCITNDSCPTVKKSGQSRPRP